MLKTIRLLLVDDHEIVRLGLRTLFSHSQRITIVGEANSVATAVSEATRLKPDVVLLDIRLPDGSGLDACREIRDASASTQVLFLTSYADDHAMLTAVLGGAAGYLLKEIGGEALVHAITTVAEGRTLIDPATARPFLDNMRGLISSGRAGMVEALSPQEERVLALVADGKTNKEVAAALNLSDKTVKNYLSHVFQKLQITRRAQAAAFYARRRP